MQKEEHTSEGWTLTNKMCEINKSSVGVWKVVNGGKAEVTVVKSLIKRNMIFQAEFLCPVLPKMFYFWIFASKTFSSDWGGEFMSSSERKS